MYCQMRLKNQLEEVVKKVETVQDKMEDYSDDSMEEIKEETWSMMKSGVL